MGVVSRGRWIWTALAAVHLVALPLSVYVVSRCVLPPTQLTLKLDADGGVLLSMRNALATIETQGGLRWPEDEPVAWAFFRHCFFKSGPDESGLPKHRVRLSMDEGASAQVLFDLVVLCYRRFITEVTLEVGNEAVDVQMRRDEGCNVLPGLGKLKDRAFVGLLPPQRGNAAWTVTEAKVENVLAIHPVYEEMFEEIRRARAEGDPDVAWYSFLEEFLDCTTIVGLEIEGLDLMVEGQWRALLEKAVQKSSVEYRSLDGLDLDGFDAAYIECTADGKAIDVVRALRTLQARCPGLKTYLVGTIPSRR